MPWSGSVRQINSDAYELRTPETSGVAVRDSGPPSGIETICDEIKDRVRGDAPLLRSKRPDLVKQDFYALLLAHFGVRSLMLEAAREAGVEPDELSFTHALSVIIRRLPEMVSFSPSFQAALP